MPDTFMSTKTTSTSQRRRRGPSNPQRKTAKRKTHATTTRATTTRPTAVAKRAAKPKRAPAAAAAKRTATTSPRTDAPLSEKAIAAAREKLEQLGQKWKSLLPRLKQVGR